MAILLYIGICWDGDEGQTLTSLSWVLLCSMNNVTLDYLILNYVGIFSHFKPIFIQVRFLSISIGVFSSINCLEMYAWLVFPIHEAIFVVWVSPLVEYCESFVYF